MTDVKETAERISTERLAPWPLGGYAPGNYTCVCADCAKMFEGDKRAMQCLECAVSEIKTQWQALASRHADAQEGGEASNTKNTVSDERLAEIVRGFDGLEVCAPADRLGPEETLSMARELQPLRASIPGGVGVLSVADAITQLSAAVEAEKRRNTVRDQMLATVIVNLEKSEMTAEFALLLRDYVRAERAKLSALDLSPAEGKPDRDMRDGMDCNYPYCGCCFDSKCSDAPDAALSNPVVSDEVLIAVATLYGNYIPGHGWTGFGPTPEQIAAALSVNPQSGSDKP